MYSKRKEQAAAALEIGAEVYKLTVSMTARDAARLRDEVASAIAVGIGGLSALQRTAAARDYDALALVIASNKGSFE